jgi:hypothetical protein
MWAERSRYASSMEAFSRDVEKEGKAMGQEEMDALKQRNERTDLAVGNASLEDLDDLLRLLSVGFERNL